MYEIAPGCISPGLQTVSFCAAALVCAAVEADQKCYEDERGEHQAGLLFALFVPLSLFFMGGQPFLRVLRKQVNGTGWRRAVELARERSVLLKRSHCCIRKLGRMRARQITLDLGTVLSPVSSWRALT